jgi:hypothetical protein
VSLWLRRISSECAVLNWVCACILHTYCRLEHTSKHDKAQKDEHSLHENSAKLDRPFAYIASSCLYCPLSFLLVVGRRQYIFEYLSVNHVHVVHVDHIAKTRSNLRAPRAGDVNTHSLAKPLQ